MNLPQDYALQFYYSQKYATTFYLKHPINTYIIQRRPISCCGKATAACTGTHPRDKRHHDLIDDASVSYSAIHGQVGERNSTTRWGLRETNYIWSGQLPKPTNISRRGRNVSPRVWTHFNPLSSLRVGQARADATTWWIPAWRSPARKATDKASGALAREDFWSIK